MHIHLQIVLVQDKCFDWCFSSKRLVNCQLRHSDRNFVRDSRSEYLGNSDCTYISVRGMSFVFVVFLIQKLPYEFRNQDFGQLGCVSFPFLQSAAILSNALILCLIAYDRYVCVVKMHPNAIKQKPGWPIIGSIITVWIVSIGMEIF